MSSTTSTTGHFAPAETTGEPPAMRAILAAHQAPVLWRSIVQVATTFLPFLAVVAAMYLLYHVSVWLTLALSVPAAGFIVRIFIIQHDCGHGAFFRNRAANEWLGRVCGVFTMTPYANWRRHHAHHHANWNNLDRRDVGADIYSNCLTVAEYAALSPARRWRYRAVRHPVIAQLLLPPVVFILLYRYPFDTPMAWQREWLSVLLTDLALVGVFGALVLLLGVGPVLLVQLPAMVLAAIIGAWIFSVQHRFEHAEWARQADWSVKGAALHGSSYLKLPRILNWFTSNIGFHHIHHLMPRVPNYRLESCHRALAAIVTAAPPLTLGLAFRSSTYALWDEERGMMVRFRDVRRRRLAA